MATALRGRGLAVRTDVGLSDFRVDLTLAHASAPDEPLVVVLLDGPGWARRRTVADRDGMPRAVLRSVLGWPAVRRVWLPQWLADRETVVAELLAALDTARTAAPSPDSDADTEQMVLGAGPVEITDESDDTVSLSSSEMVPLPGAPPADEPVSGPPSIPEPAENGSGEELIEPRVPLAEDEVVEFVAWPPRQVGERTILDRLDDRAAANQVRNIVAEVVAAEAPIELKRLTRLVAGAFGLERVRQERHEAILGLLRRDVRIDRKDGFAWPPHLSRRSWRGYRVSDDPTSRPLQHIPLVEIANAMYATRQRLDLTWDSEELLRATLAVFGAKRLTDGAWSRLDEARRLARRLDG